MSFQIQPNSRAVVVFHNIRAICTGLVGILFSLFLAGCGGFFAEKPTVIESRAILNDIAQVRENPNTKNPLPEFYQSGPKKVSVQDGIKLFYFTKHHPSPELAANISQVGFKVSNNPSTNQLIIHCTDDAQAQQALEYLEKVDVPPIQVNIDCLILDRFGDVTTDWETSLLMENLFGEGVTLGEKKYPNPAFPGARLREIKRGEFGLDFGYWIDKGASGHQVRLLVDMLESRGYLKVLMNPTLETVNGKTATVQIRDNAPIQVTVTSKGAGGTTESYELTKYEWVEDTLTVTPTVFADGFIGLTTSIVVGSKSKPEGIVQNPIITKRTIDIAENRIEPGKSLIIGGFRKSENRSVVRGVPFFKDIPIIGVLFSSRDFEERASEIIFILTPSISSGAIDNARMVENIRKKFAAPEHEAGLTEVLTDPLGTGVYTDLVEQEASKAEIERARAELQRVAAEKRSQNEKYRAERAQIDAQRIKILADKAAIGAEKARAEAEQAKIQAQTAQQQAQAEKAKADQALAEKEKTAVEVETAKAQAEQALKEAQQAADRVKELEKKAGLAAEEAKKIKALAEQAQTEAVKAKTAAQQAQTEAERAKEEAQKAKNEAEKAKVQAQPADAGSQGPDKEENK